MVILAFSSAHTHQTLGNDNLRNFIQDIKNSLDKGTFIDVEKYKLTDEYLSSFSIKDYLFFYRGAGLVLQAENQASRDHEHGIKLFKEALRSLKLARLGSLKDKPIDTFEKRARLGLIELYFQNKDYNNLIAEIEEFSEQYQVSNKHKTYYLISLLETGQKNHIAPYLNAEKHLLTDIHSDKTLVSYKEDLEPYSILIKKNREPLNKSALPINKSSALNNSIDENWNYIINHFYSKKSPLLFKTLEEKYFSILKMPEIKRDNENKKYIIEFEKKIRRLHPDLIVIHVKKLWQSSYLEKALSLTNFYLNNHKGHGKYPEMLYDQGRLQEDSAHYQAAQKSFSSALSLLKDTAFEEQAYFRLAWTSYLAKKSDARFLFKNYLQLFPNGTRASTARYFYLKEEARFFSKDKKESLRLRNEAIKYINENPLSFYSQLLIKEWNLPDTEITKFFSSNEYVIKKEDPLLASSIGMNRVLKRYNELKNFALIEDARLLLKQIGQTKDPVQFSLFKAREFKQLGSSCDFILTATELYQNNKSLMNLFSLADIFPNLFDQPIKKALTQKTWDLNPFIVTSLIRQESVFDSKATSQANARGLMQIINPTAKLIAKELNLKSYNIEDPEDNIAMGVYLLQKLLKKYQGNLYYSLSAYNAGETVTDRWISLRGHLSPLEFIESIPYRETLNYIKNILRNSLFYQHIYEQKSLSNAVVSYTVSANLDVPKLVKDQPALGSGAKPL